MLTIFFILSFATLLFVYLTKKPRNFPPGPLWLPVFGCSLQVNKEAKRRGLAQNVLFRVMCQKWKTNILGLKLGEQVVVFVSTYDALKKLYRNKAFDARPDNFFVKLRTLGTCPGITCAEGRFHDVHKKFVLTNWWGGSGKNAVQMNIRDELEDVVRIIDLDHDLVNIGKLVQPAVVNVIWSLLTGTRLDRSDKKFQKLLKDLDDRVTAFDMAGGVLSNYPWMRYIAPNLTGYNTINEVNLKLKDYIMETITYHNKTWYERSNDDLIYSFISRMRSKNETSGTFHNDQLLMIAVDLFLGGAHTTSAALDFACLAMVLYPEIQHKVQDSLDQKFDSNYAIQYSDRFKVPYVLAVLYEVIRFFHVIPIGGSRRALRTVQLEEYTIPKGTVLLIDLQSILMSKELWKDPEVFRPERFLKGDKIRIPDGYVPFGMGRRRCLGEMFALRFLFLFFTELLRRYEILPELGKPLPSPIPIPGIVFTPQPYSARFILRRRL